MNVLVVLGGIGIEGVSNVALTYLEEIDKSNMSISLAIGGPTEKMMFDRAEKIGIPLIKLPYRKHDPINFYPALIKLVRKNKYDVIHVHGNSATMALDLIAARIGGCPVRIPHTHNTVCDNGKLNKILQPILIKVMTEGFACGVDAGNWLYRNNDYKVINNGRKIENYLFDDNKRVLFRKMLGLSKQNYAIGHVGTFTEQKNQRFLINAFAKIKNDDFQLYLFGDGVNRQENEKYVRKLNLKDKVHFMGNVANINEYLHAMDVMALPSLYEGLPLVVLEWQINKLPCVISEQVTKECKLMDNVSFVSMNEANYQDWADEIQRLARIGRSVLSNQAIRDKISDAGYNITYNAQALKEEYMILLEKKRKK